MQTFLRSYLVILFLLQFTFFGFAQRKTVARGKGELRLSLQLLKTHPNAVKDTYGRDSLADIKVVIKNNTDTLASFYETWNMWGHDAIKLQLSSGDTLVTLHYTGCWGDKNFPSAELLFPGDSIVFYYKISCESRQGCGCFITYQKGKEVPVSGFKGRTIRAVYQNDLLAHDQEISDAQKEGKLFPAFIALYSRHAKKFSKLTDVQKRRSFVRDKLISEMQNIHFDTW